MILKFFILIQCFISAAAFACTSFGVITDQGLIFGKNRDYTYSAQVFTRINPLKQFADWYGNTYNHHFPFYALISKNDVKFGINEAGLSAIEEDPVVPFDGALHRKYLQPYIGYSEGMILYGLLQNFANVEEIVPHIDQIFSTAAPNFYQVADANSILLVEVAFGESNDDPKRAYKYTIINRPGEYFAHTNTYLNPTFKMLNKIPHKEKIIQGSETRLKAIKQKILSAKGDFSQAFFWYLDTSSVSENSIDQNFCQNTSIFRSDLQHISTVTDKTDSNSIYGTVSSFMVEYKKDKPPLIHIRLLESINTEANGDQKIVYKTAKIAFDKLFARVPLDYSTHSFTRPAPKAGICLPSLTE